MPKPTSLDRDSPHWDRTAPRNVVLTRHPAPHLLCRRFPGKWLGRPEPGESGEELAGCLTSVPAPLVGAGQGGGSCRLFRLWARGRQNSSLARPPSSILPHKRGGNAPAPTVAFTRWPCGRSGPFRLSLRGKVLSRGRSRPL